MRFLTIGEVLAIHERILEEIGGLKGLRDPGLLQAAVEKPKTAVFGIEAYPSLFLKSAVFLEALANYHVFVDGNKRTAFVSAAMFLRANGYSIVAAQKEVVQLMMQVAKKKFDIQTIARWLKTHAKKIS